MAATAKTIAKGVFYTSVGNALIKVLAIVGYVIIVSRLSVYDYGFFLFLISFMQPASAIIYFGFGNIFKSSFAKARGAQNIARMKGLVKEYFGSAFILAVLFFIITFALRSWLVKYYEISFLDYIWLIYFYILAQLLINAIELFLESNERFSTIAVLQSLEAIVRFLLVVFFLNSLSVWHLIIIYSSAKFFAVVVGILCCLKPLGALFDKRVEGEKRVLITILKDYGKWEIIRNIIENISSSLKVWIIKIVINVEAIAIFDVAQNIYGALMSLVPIRKVIFPVISRKIENREVVGIIIAKAKKYTLLSYIIFYLAALITFPPLFNLIFPNYSSELLIVFICLLHMFVEVYRIGQGPLMYALNQQKFLTIIYPFTFTLELIIYLLLSYYFGLIGFLFAWHIHVTIIGIIVGVHLKRKFDLDIWKWRDFFTFDSYDKFILQKLQGAIKGRYLKLIKPHN